MSSDPKSGEQPNIQSSPPTITKQDDSKDAAAAAAAKKTSRWKKAFNTLMLRSKASKAESPKSDSPPPLTAVSRASKLIDSIKSYISHISVQAKNLEQHNTKLITDHLEQLNKNYEEIKLLKEGDQKVKRLDDLKKDLIKLNLAVPSNSKVGADQKKDPLKNLNFTSSQADSGGALDNMPHLHKNDVIETSMEYKEFEARYSKLDDRLKLCLLCFSIFPGNAIIKKRLMLQWWVAEGYAVSEEVAHAHFKDLMDKGFIEPVNPNRSRSVGSCRIHPFNRSALVALAKRANFFNFGAQGDPTQNFSGCYQACLMGAGLISYEDFKEKNDKLGKGGDQNKLINGLITDLEKLHLLMNVDEHILEFISEWFERMRNLNFLYLGRWKASATHHIEVEDAEFLKELQNMRYVKFLSLQGVSNVISLPESIQKMTNLNVLDLRACYNLESIPEGIGRWLERLTHLDMSECYLLAQMPKSLSELNNLKVLKGFFVLPEGDPKKKGCCTIGDLQDLKHLEKLCIYTNWEKFPVEEDVEGLEKLTKLSKLTITWGVSVLPDKKSKKQEEAEAQGSSKLPASLKKLPAPDKKSKKQEEAEAQGSSKLPASLQKLDLKCFPMSVTPYWLKIQNLYHTKLKKLYIRGGKFCDVGQYQGIDEKTWKVEVLRLKYLAEIEMEWRRLQELFPELKYLEQVSCPNLTLFPCDAKGLWINPQ